MQTIHNQPADSNPDGDPNPDDVQKWRSYLGIAPNQSNFSLDHANRLAFTKMFNKYKSLGASIFHMTVTYKNYQNFQYSPKNINDFFTNFYLKSFLPFLLETKNIHKKRFMQPICFAFLDEHESVPKAMAADYMFPLRLHHHAVLAVHPIVVQYIERMQGENMITYTSKYSSKVMTTHLRECDPMTVLYATKRLRQYPDYLAFPDRLH